MKPDYLKLIRKRHRKNSLLLPDSDYEEQNLHFNISASEKAYLSISILYHVKVSIHRNILIVNHMKC